MAPEIILRKAARAQGLKRYFTGKPCKRGHIAERHVNNLTCMECDREKNAVRYPFRDKEKSRVARLAWGRANREKVNAASREANATPERKAYKAAWYAANRERIRAKAKEHPGKYRESNIASAKAWAEANPEKAREYGRIARRRRRARAKNSGGTHTAADIAKILKAQGYRCAYCQANLKRVKQHVDHIVPLALGGSNGRQNLQVTCRACNQSKSAKHPIDHARSLGLLL